MLQSSTSDPISTIRSGLGWDVLILLHSKRQLMQSAAQQTVHISWKGDLVVVCSGLSSGQRSCPGFWPLPPRSALLWRRSVCTAVCKQQRKRRTYRAQDLWNMVLCAHFFQWCIVYTTIDSFINCQWIWTAACVSMHLILPLHCIDPALVFTST